MRRAGRAGVRRRVRSSATGAPSTGTRRGRDCNRGRPRRVWEASPTGTSPVSQAQGRIEELKVSGSQLLGTLKRIVREGKGIKNDILVDGPGFGEFYGPLRGRG